MTNSEASFILANVDRRVCDDELNEALDMAIKALEQLDKIKAVIETSNMIMQEDVLKYKVICELMEGEG